MTQSDPNPFQAPTTGQGAPPPAPPQLDANADALLQYVQSTSTPKLLVAAVFAFFGVVQLINTWLWIDGGCIRACPWESPPKRS